MLPKLQQSSLATSLRRDNLASQIQCTYLSIQARTNSKASSINKTMRPISHGKISMLPKTLIVHLETSLVNTSPNKKPKKCFMSPSMNIPYLDLLPSTTNPTEMEEEAQAL